MNRRGIALLVTVGILTLLAVTAVAMVRMAAQLRARSGLSVDHVSARLLARAGVEYAQARLILSIATPAAKTPENQPDDWTCRDDRGVPLEQAFNPSYAQTEPYRDDYPVGGFVSGSPGNGRYDSGNDSYTDRNINGRFDSWSGRLRNRYGAGSGTFALKVSGENTEGGLNVNSGMLDNADINGNGIPDYQDMEGPPGPYDYVNLHQARNRRMAFTINQLAAMLGSVRGSLEGQRVAAGGGYSNANVAPGQGVSAGRQEAVQPESQAAGERIVLNRPLGGYREVDEVARLFPVPGEWERLRPHLSVSGRRNPAARQLLGTGDATVMGGTQLGKGWLVRDEEYFVDVEKASVESMAALFAHRGVEAHISDTNNTANELSLSAYLSHDEALRAARFIKGRAFRSWYDFYLALQDAAGSLFDPPIYPDPSNAGRSPMTASDKAAWVYALSDPEEAVYYLGGPLGVPAYHSTSPFYSWASSRCWRSHDVWTRDPQRELEQISSLYASAGAGIAGAAVAMTGKGNAGANAAVATGLPRSRGSAAPLSFGELSVFAIESLGRVSDGKRHPLASVGSRGEFSRGMTELRVAGSIQARTQDDFENLNFDRANRGFRTSRRFEGGTVEGRPTRDRVASTPCFSRDACLELSQSPLLDFHHPPPGDFDGSTPPPFPPALPRDVFYDYNYCRFFGEVMLSDRSWVDPDPGQILYLPNWDLDQPERPRPDPAAFHYWQNWDDAVQGVPWRRGPDSTDAEAENSAAGPPGPLWLRACLLRAGCIGGGNACLDGHSRTAGGAALFQGGCSHDAKRLLLPPESPDNTVHGGTFAGWIGRSDEADYSAANFDPAQYPVEYRDRVSSTDCFFACASALHFVAGSAASGGYAPSITWKNPAPPDRERGIHYAFTLGGGAFNAYVDGIWRGTDRFAPYVVAPGSESASARAPDEFRLYRDPLQAARIAAHALRGRFWTADGPGYETVPSFISPLYRFDHRARLLHVGWDGFVPSVIRDAVNSSGGPTTLRLELMLYRTGLPGETPAVIPLPEDSWKTGGCRAKFKDLWKSVDSGIAPVFKALRYRVWLDASGLDLAWETPVFDGIEISYKFGRDGSNDE